MGVFENAKRIETREDFINSRVRRKRYGATMLAEMEDYILSDRCVNDIERLERGDYFLDYPQYRLVPKNFQNKKRAVYLMKGEQGFLMKLIVHSMSGVEEHYSDRLFSFRSDRTGTDLLNEVRKKDMGNMYVLKTDVSNYVGSIVPEFVVPMIEEIYMPDDPAFFRFLEWFLTRGKVIDRNGDVIDHCPGGMGGIPIGNFLMNLYLHEMDDYYESRAAFYSRYSDDILICSYSYDEIKEFEKKFYEILDRLRLTTNKEKTGILMPGEAFDLLGMELANGSISISEHSMKKLKRKIRRYANKGLLNRNRGLMTADEAARDFIIRFNRFFFGVDGRGTLLAWAKWAFPVITDTRSLEELDHYIQDSLRYILYGSMKKRKESIPYEKLSELGYKTLVYYYHHPDRIAEIPREFEHSAFRRSKEAR